MWYKCKLVYLPLTFDTSGLDSSESALIATAFLILFMAFPPTLVLRALGLDWVEETEICIQNIYY